MKTSWICGIMVWGLMLGIPLAQAGQVVHNTTALFAGGTFSSVEDTGSGSSPSLQLTRNADFGDGHDGQPVSSGTINSYAAMTGSSGTTIVYTSLQVAVGDVVLLHQSQYSGAGAWELVKALSATSSNQFTTTSVLQHTFTSGAQAVLVPQYTTGTIGGTISATAWNGSYGGIVALMANGSVTLSGSINVSGTGFRGGYSVGGGAPGCDSVSYGYKGESYAATQTNPRNQSGYANGGGGGQSNEGGNGGGGGGNGSIGAYGGTRGSCSCCGGGNPGDYGGNADLSIAVFGGGGGSGGGECNKDGNSHSGPGGVGGGLVFIFAKSLNVTGSIVANGGGGSGPYGTGEEDGGGGGGGAGGCIYAKAQALSLNSNSMTAYGGGGGSCGDNSGGGGAGGSGRIRVDFVTAGGYAFGSGNATSLVNNGCDPDPGSGTLVAYLTPGSYTSSVITITGAAALGNLLWTENLGTSGDVVFQTRTGPTSNPASGWEDWKPTTPLTNPSGSPMQSTANNYIQYQATLSTSDNSLSPALSSVTLNYDVAPTVSITSISGQSSYSGIWTGGNIPIVYSLADAESDTCSLQVQYNVGGGWTTASAGSGGDGTSGLSSSGGGISHTFLWGSATDLGGTSYTNVQVRLRANDGAVYGSYATSTSFGIDASAPVSTIVQPAPGAALVHLTTISGTADDGGTGSSGVAAVVISIKRNRDNQFWSGAVWQGGEVWLSTIGTTNWYRIAGLPTWEVGNYYTIRSVALDAAGNQETPGSGNVWMSTSGVPFMMNYQGRVLNASGETVYSGTQEMTFSFFSAPSGGSPLWSEMQPVFVNTNGVYNVIIGSTTGIPENIASATECWFGVNLGGEDLLPRQRIVSTMYSMRSRLADNVADDSITSSQIVNESILGNDISLPLTLNQLTGGEVLKCQANGINLLKVKNTGMVLKVIATPPADVGEDGEVRVYRSGNDYRLYIFLNGGWRYTQLN